MNKTIAFVLVTVGVLVLSFIVPKMLFNGVIYTKLTQDGLDYGISHSLQTESNYLPVNGVDYLVSKTVYFNNNTWSVVTLRQTTSNNSSLEVFQIKNNNYNLVLGPGSYFNSIGLKTLPADVSNYISR